MKKLFFISISILLAGLFLFQCSNDDGLIETGTSSEHFSELKTNKSLNSTNNLINSNNTSASLDDEACELRIENQTNCVTYEKIRLAVDVNEFSGLSCFDAATLNACIDSKAIFNITVCTDPSGTSYHFEFVGAETCQAIYWDLQYYNGPCTVEEATNQYYNYLEETATNNWMLTQLQLLQVDCENEIVIATNYAASCYRNEKIYGLIPIYCWGDEGPYICGWEQVEADWFVPCGSGCCITETGYCYTNGEIETTKTIISDGPCEITSTSNGGKEDSKPCNQKCDGSVPH